MSGQRWAISGWINEKHSPGSRRHSEPCETRYRDSGHGAVVVTTQGKEVGTGQGALAGAGSVVADRTLKHLKIFRNSIPLPAMFQKYE